MSGLLYYTEVKIPVRQGDDGTSLVTLWAVTGIDGVLYPTKFAAEVAACVYFHTETIDTRYARIRSIDFTNLELS